MTATVLPMLRWSTVRDCPRKAVYEAEGAPARERTDREERIMFRGKRLGRDYADMLAMRHGEDALERERTVAWPLGIGHIDIYLKPTRTAIEVLSSAHASDAMIRSKLVQLVGYIEHDDEAENGVLVILNPSDYDEDRIILAPTSRLYGELVEEMRQRIGEVQAWASGGQTPGRVCRKPSDARGHFCPYATHCFDGWEPEPLNQVDDERARDLAIVLYHVKGREHELKAGLKAAETERKSVEAELADLIPPGTVQAGDYKLTRTHTQRKPTFQWERAEAAGQFNPDAYESFFKAGASYDTWKVERAPTPHREVNDGVDQDIPF